MGEAGVWRRDKVWSHLYFDACTRTHARMHTTQAYTYIHTHAHTQTHAHTHAHTTHTHTTHTHTMKLSTVTGKVAENMRSCLSLGRWVMTRSKKCCMSMERSLSASSSTRMPHPLMLATPFSTKSSRRPGVPTIT